MIQKTTFTSSNEGIARFAFADCTVPCAIRKSISEVVCTQKHHITPQHQSFIWQNPLDGRHWPHMTTLCNKWTCTSPVLEVQNHKQNAFNSSSTKDLTLNPLPSNHHHHHHLNPACPHSLWAPLDLLRQLWLYRLQQGPEEGRVECATLRQPLRKPLEVKAPRWMGFFGEGTYARNMLLSWSIWKCKLSWR